jgi:hypothetical protein
VSPSRHPHLWRQAISCQPSGRAANGRAGALTLPGWLGRGGLVSAPLCCHQEGSQNDAPNWAQVLFQDSAEQGAKLFAAPVNALHTGWRPVTDPVAEHLAAGTMQRDTGGGPE